MTIKTSKIVLFKNQKIRRDWNKKEQKWYFSVIDVVSALVGQLSYQKSRKYWNKLAERLRNERSEAVTKCHRLKELVMKELRKQKTLKKQEKRLS